MARGEMDIGLSEVASKWMNLEILVRRSGTLIRWRTQIWTTFAQFVDSLMSVIGSRTCSLSCENEKNIGKNQPHSAERSPLQMAWSVVIHYHKLLAKGKVLYFAPTCSQT